MKSVEEFPLVLPLWSPPGPPVVAARCDSRGSGQLPRCGYTGKITAGDCKLVCKLSGVHLGSQATTSRLSLIPQIYALSRGHHAPFYRDGIWPGGPKDNGRAEQQSSQPWKPLLQHHDH